MNLGLKIEASKDDDWDFRYANTKEFTHCFHQYPAMMIPQVARRIISTYGAKVSLLFDPYCGTGTSLVEANLAGICAVGTDINPLARLIAKTKTSRIDIDLLDRQVDALVEFSLTRHLTNSDFSLSVPDSVTNVDFWFSQFVQRELGIALSFIDSIKNHKIRDFFRVAFSEVVRETSNVKPGEFKLVRNKKLEDRVEPDVFGKLLNKLARNRNGLIQFQNSANSTVYSSIYSFNTIEFIPTEAVEPKSVDIVVTSPPYGDSRTTVAYGQYSRLANEWLRHSNASGIDRSLMGGVRQEAINSFHSESLSDLVETIRSRDEKRVLDVIAFYLDYERSINNVSETVKPSGYVCYVVGNRTVKGVTVPNDAITRDLLELHGFVHVETLKRNIPNKRMPSRNSPTNIIGATSDTMKHEYIVVCQKHLG